MAFDSRTVWKLVGLAGAVGVAATGALTVRAERKRRAYTPDEVRDRLHTRYAQASAAADRATVDLVPVPTRARRALRLPCRRPARRS
ncbi:hypothetical protein [Prescottella subtropica]|uniref:hypothetical protein n=1 Tax=Prescottella subtropica TaxID=2545757 RepID=UPI0010F86457|nr:hypothetical protein [Prescottella subtropica]